MRAPRMCAREFAVRRLARCDPQARFRRTRAVGDRPRFGYQTHQRRTGWRALRHARETQATDRLVALMSRRLRQERGRSSKQAPCLEARQRAVDTFGNGGMTAGLIEARQKLE